ncbi:tyrosine-protein phosphatase [Microbacterium oleivorans]|uniref:Tyrosine-protein phosphatase n=1 Tax=Microbacterium oleivorans TaxID=273677 RepID=A0A7D5EXJ3_9MICO|nr:tyrosine-protein phosphatase [Microbacterium oleivorans]QLD12631.1 tyrosine-protein phosphatase [Microbacterium oleivorans]
MTGRSAPVVSGAINFRDTGGLPAGGRATRAGVLFRSGNLFRVDDSGRQALRDLGLRRIIDLRDDDEVLSEPTVLDGFTHETQRVPLFVGSVASLFRADMSLDSMYRSLVDDSAPRVLDVVRGVLAEQPVLVHCTIGKDRTGVTIALILAAAGVDEDAVIADYARTETLLPAERNAPIIAYLRERHPDAPHLVDLATRSPAPVMRALLEDLRERFGSPREYLRAQGLDDDELAELRRILVA